MWLQYYPKVLFDIINRSGMFGNECTKDIGALQMWFYVMNYKYSTSYIVLPKSSFRYHEPISYELEH